MVRQTWYVLLKLWGMFPVGNFTSYLFITYICSFCDSLYLTSTNVDSRNQGTRLLSEVLTVVRPNALQADEGIMIGCGCVCVFTDFQPVILLSYSSLLSSVLL